MPTPRSFLQVPDPVLGVHRHYGTDQIRKGTHFVNSSRYSNPKLDALLDSGAGEPDAAKRTAAYKEIQQILADDMPVVNLFELEFLVVYNTKLKGAYGGDKTWQQGKDAKDAANEIDALHKKAEGLRGAVRDVETRVRRIHHLRH